MVKVISLEQLLPPTENPVINPHAEEVEARLLELCNELGIWQPHISEYNTMSAYLFPYANKNPICFGEVWRHLTARSRPFAIH